MDIKVEDILKISPDELSSYKLHLACWNGHEQPLDIYLENWDGWVGWNEWRGGKNDFNREYIFSLIRFYHEHNKYLFGGIFKVIERYDDWEDTEVGYKVELQNLHKNLIGRLIIDYERPQGMRGRANLLENFYESFVVSEILKKPYDGINFPGYQNIDIDFNALEQVFKIQKNDWKGALENVKGIYLIIDKSNGKKYIGSAYGDYGIWSRWSCYIGTGHGWNDQLVTLINKKGLEYSRLNFKFTLLEVMLMNTSDDYILERESFWKNVLLSKYFGYNSN